ncbi:MAG: flagellar motor protein MotB, partial [Pseudomonadota bacterium]
MGTWKLAYADFLTALCAFFLVMWIIHGVSNGEREAIAQQFGAQQFGTTTQARLASQTSAEPDTDRSDEIASAL